MTSLMHFVVSTHKHSTKKHVILFTHTANRFVTLLCTTVNFFSLNCDRAPFPPVSSFQLKISQFPVPFLYFFPTPTPCHASLPHHSANTPLQIIPSLLHTTTNPCPLLEQQLPLKSCTIKKSCIPIPIHRQSPVKSPDIKTL